MTTIEISGLLFGGYVAATVSGAAGFGGALLLLPLLSHVLGPKAAIPVLTVAQLLGNLSRVYLGRKVVQWRPALLFCLGAVPLSVLGAVLFVSTPAPYLLKGVGGFLLMMIALRHTKWGGKPLSEKAPAPAGAGVGLLSALAGSTGPLGAAVFLSLGLERGAYVATEAVTAVAMHLSKTLAYGKFALLTPSSLGMGLLLGGAMWLGSWSGKHLIDRLDERAFRWLVEALLLISGIALLLSQG